MNEHEERTCQAERDYDFQREEELLASGIYVDNSKWQTFLKDEFANFDNPDLMIKQMMGDLIDLKNARPQEKCQGEISLDAFMKEAYEIEDMKKEVF